MRLERHKLRTLTFIQGTQGNYGLALVSFCCLSSHLDVDDDGRLFLLPQVARLRDPRCSLQGQKSRDDGLCEYRANICWEQRNQDLQ